ncbi:MAG: asparagine synthetase B family protein [Promethearchaeota archaeon]|nr:MAG: asparagine synthetase B family protein [Candidatus Lokiarchaeota archaeon]
MMEYIIGGNHENPDLVIEKAIKYFENRFSEKFEFEGINENGYFLGIIKDKTNELNRNTFFFDKNKVFKSLFYHEVPEILKNDKKIKPSSLIKNLRNDYIFSIYEKEKGIKVFKDIFAREKVYFTLDYPCIFSTSFKFLISMQKKRRLNPDAMARYLGTGLNIGEETVFNNIHRLDIGEFLHVRNKNIEVNKDWIINKKFFEVPHHNVKDISFWVDHIYNVFKNAMEFPVKKPILSMMSGGLDSTVITSIFAKEFDIPIEALTIKVPNYNEEEVQKAIEVAEHIDIPLHVKEYRIKSLKGLNESFSEIFNILEEPMGGTAYFSRYFAFNEVMKLKDRNIMLGEGAGEVMSYLRHNIFENYKYTNYLFNVPIKLRTALNNILNKLYYPSLHFTKFLKNKNLINSIDILLNSNFLQSKSEIQTFLTSVQFCNVNDAYRITSKKVNFDAFIAANLKKYNEYPFYDHNKYGYQLLNLSPNGDPLISHVLSSFYGLKLYCPYLSDISFKKLLPLPPYIKLTGEGYRTRYKWIVRAIAMRKKLLPKAYFSWKPKYGLRQEFFNPESFNAVKSFALELIDSLSSTNLVNLGPFKKYFRNSTLRNITKHSTEYLKFNIWLGFIGWLASIS